MRIKKRYSAFFLSIIIFFFNNALAQESTVNTDKPSENPNITVTDSLEPGADAGESTGVKAGSALNREEKIKYKKFDVFLAAGIGIMRGHTTYQIGDDFDSPEGSGKIHFPLSELVFPLNTWMVSAEAGLLYIDKFKTDLKFRTNIIKKTDNMKDSDWGIPWEYPENSGDYWWYGPDHLDIYSESKTELRAIILDFDILYKFLKRTFGYPVKKNLALFAGLGYIYQKYDFECRLIRQYDYRYDAPAKQRKDSVGDGSIGLTYEVFTHIPYIKFAAELLLTHGFSLDASLGYSPYVKLEDRDNHILRSKISKAKCRGTAYLITAGTKYMITDKIFSGLNLEFISIDTKGRQKQYDEGAWSATIDQKNFSKRLSLDLSAGYLF